MSRIKTKEPMKKMKFISCLVLLMLAIPQTGNAQFLKKLGKALETVNQTLETINQTLDPEKKTQQAAEKVVEEKKAEATQAVTNVVNNATQTVAAKVAEYVAPEFLVHISGNKVNVRKTPTTSGEVVTQAGAGTLYEFVSEQDGWFEVKVPGSAENCYVSATVAAKVALATVPRTDKGIVKAAGTDLIYQKTENTSSYSLISSYTITQGSQAGEVEAYYNEHGAYADGRFIPAEEYYMKGKQLGWCIVLDQMQNTFSEEWEKMESPIVIYAADATGRKVVIAGETYTLTRESY